jgi:hypothetical protein
MAQRRADVEFAERLLHVIDSGCRTATYKLALSLGIRWTASMTAQRSSRDPCLVTRPRLTLRSDSRCRGVSPVHEHSRAVVRNLPASPISAMITAARTGPMPGNCWITW